MAKIATVAWGSWTAGFVESATFAPAVIAHTGRAKQVEVAYHFWMVDRHRLTSWNGL